MIRIGFTGTQDGMITPQRDGVHDYLSAQTDAADVWFHHGDCVGADAEAHEIARYYHCRVIIHPPLRDAKRAFKVADELRMPKNYLDRNRDIALECKILLATPKECKEQLRSGTWATIRAARKLGREIHIIFSDGTTQKENAP